MEKLMEEIGQIVSRGMGIVVEGGTDGVSRSLYRQRDRIVADIVAWLPRIGKAYADGMELPDEVGRGFLERTINEDRVWWAEGASALEHYREVDFIALCKEEDFQEFIMRETEAAVEGGIIDENTGLPFELEGTGKEEEG